jgi:peptidyl-prolyl cis-trans isomerase SurA
VRTAGRAASPCRLLLATGLATGLLVLAGPVGAQSAPAAPSPGPASAPSTSKPSAPGGDAESRGIVLDRVVAVVNDEAVTLSEVQEEGQPVIRKVFQDYVGPEREKRVVEAEKKVLDDLIDRRLMLQVAKREGNIPSPAEVKGAIDELKKTNNVTTDEEFRALLGAEGMTLEQVQRAVTERMAIGRLMARQVRATIIVEEDELKRYYAAHADKYRREPEAKIHHILIAPRPGEIPADAQARAEAAQAKIRAGGDMDAVAREYVPGVAGADQMVVKRGELAPEIEKAAFDDPLGTVGPLVKTESGWHIIRVDQRQADPVVPYAEVRDAIRDAIFQEKFEAKRKEWVAKLRQQSYIQIVMPAAGQLLGGQAQQAQQGSLPPHP